MDKAEAKELLEKFTDFFEECRETCFENCVDCFLKEEYGGD